MSKSKEALDIIIASLPVDGGTFELRAMVVGGTPMFDTFYIDHEDTRRERVRQSHINTECEITAAQIFAQRLTQASWKNLTI